MKILISLSVTYKDIKSSKPRLKLHLPKRRLKARRKKPKPTDRLAVLKRKLGNIRMQIKHRLNDVTFRLGPKKRIPAKRVETQNLYLKYKRLEEQIKKIEESRKAVSQGMRLI